MDRNLAIVLSVLVVAMLVGLPIADGWADAQRIAANPAKVVEDVVVVNETDMTLTVFFVGENGNRGTEVPPRLAVAMKVNPERNTLGVKAVAFRPDGSVAGIANHTYHLKNPKETGWWKVAPNDL